MRTLFATAALARPRRRRRRPAPPGGAPSPPPPAAVDAALDHLRARGPAAGLKAADVAELAAAGAHVGARTGLAYVYVQQRLGGVDVRGARVSVAVDAGGRVVHAAGALAGGLAAPGVQKAASLTAAAALARAASLVGEPLAPRLSSPLGSREASRGPSRETVFGEVHGDAVTARLVYAPTEREGLRLAWEVVLPTGDGAHVWEVVVDAATGAELGRHDRVAQDRWGPPEAASPHEASGARGSALAPGASGSLVPLASGASASGALVPLASGTRGWLARGSALLDAASYLVYTAESPSHAAVLPPADGRVAVSGRRATPRPPPSGGTTPTASPAPSSRRPAATTPTPTPTATRTTPPTPAGEPDGGAALAFAFPLDLAEPPAAYTAAATTNLFYWTNVVHDVLYRYGFDEAAGNFQATNYGGVGAGGDEVRAEAQDGASTNNARFYTPPEGERPRMQLYEWTSTSPRRDGDLDAAIIAHEYGHGVSTRLTGGASAVGCLGNREQMGEGWSDFYGLLLTMEAGRRGGSRGGWGRTGWGSRRTGRGCGRRRTPRPSG